jgi:hypothetical protein
MKRRGRGRVGLDTKQLSSTLAFASVVLANLGLEAHRGSERGEGQGAGSNSKRFACRLGLVSWEIRLRGLGDEAATVRSWLRGSERWVWRGSERSLSGDVQNREGQRLRPLEYQIL